MALIPITKLLRDLAEGNVQLLSSVCTTGAFGSLLYCLSGKIWG